MRALSLPSRSRSAPSLPRLSSVPTTAANYVNVHAEIARSVSMVFPVSRVVELVNALEKSSSAATTATASHAAGELSKRGRLRC